jgi:predicted Zn-ribbon and HTH transcriptional regulator
MNTIQTQEVKTTAKCGSCKFETMGKNGYLICSNKKSGHYYIDISDTCGFSEAKEMIEYFRCWKCNDNKKIHQTRIIKKDRRRKYTYRLLLSNL